MWCSVVQCVAVCCSVLQYVAVCLVWCSVFGVLQCVAVCFSVLQREKARYREGVLERNRQDKIVFVREERKR